MQRRARVRFGHARPHAADGQSDIPRPVRRIPAPLRTPHARRGFFVRRAGGRRGRRQAKGASASGARGREALRFLDKVDKVLLFVNAELRIHATHMRSRRALRYLKLARNHGKGPSARNQLENIEFARG